MSKLFTTYWAPVAWADMSKKQKKVAVFYVIYQLADASWQLYLQMKIAKQAEMVEIQQQLINDQIQVIERQEAELALLRPAPFLRVVETNDEMVDRLSGKDA